MEVKLYGSPTCPHCHNAREFLKEKGIKFQDIDVVNNQKALDEMVKISGQRGVPVIIIGDQMVIGFDRPAIEAALSGKKPAGPGSEVYR